MLEAHGNVTADFKSLMDVINMVDARDAVVSCLDFGHQIVNQVIEIFRVDPPGDDILVNVHFLGSNLTTLFRFLQRFNIVDDVPSFIFGQDHAPWRHFIAAIGNK